MQEGGFSTSTVSINTGLGGGLMRILMSDNVEPGTDVSYQLAKDILIYHPLGQKMAEAPISMAQAQDRKVSVQDAPEEVTKAFTDAWEEIAASTHIHNLCKLARVYGLSSLIMGCADKTPASKELNMWDLHKLPIFFSELDPLNTAGSLVLSQVPTSPEFNRPAKVISNGEDFHRSRYIVMMNENPVYLSYTSSAFGFVGRSVYQRALFPLKSFIRTMIADDMIATKLALLIAKQKAPGSVINRVMQQIAGMKRALLKRAHSGQVLSIDVEEDIETLDMQNVDGAGTYSRNNILKNCATAADMPAKLLENETMVGGFAEGTEDAAAIASYIDRIRIWMAPPYKFFDNVVQYKAWSEDFYKTIQVKYPDYKGIDYKDAFMQWRKNFVAEWPSVFKEKESEAIKSEDTKLNAIIQLLAALMPELDPENKAQLIQTALENVSENKRMFVHEFVLDFEGLKDFAIENQERKNEAEDVANTATEASAKAPKPKKIGHGS